MRATGYLQRPTGFKSDRGISGSPGSPFSYADVKGIYREFKIQFVHTSGQKGVYIRDAEAYRGVQKRGLYGIEADNRVNKAEKGNDNKKNDIAS